MSDDHLYQRILNKHLPSGSEIINVQHVSGGCINNTVRVSTSNGSFFIKTNTSKEVDLFEKECRGLQTLKKASPVKTPDIIGAGTEDHQVYILLEWIERGLPSSSFWEAFGEQLAKQHLQSDLHFGLVYDNHIGRLPQSNKQHQSWYDFFIQERLMPQVALAKQANLLNAALIDQFESFYQKLPNLVPAEPPALLHGDLWNGNFLCSSGSEAYIFDPAVYYGHRETELAFTELFGGFDSEFYKAYHQTYPLAPNFDERVDIHNLYPLLVHVNLFGPSYLSGIRSTLKKFA